MHFSVAVSLSLLAFVVVGVKGKVEPPDGKVSKDPLDSCNAKDGTCAKKAGENSEKQLLSQVAPFHSNTNSLEIEISMSNSSKLFKFPVIADNTDIEDFTDG